MRHQSQRLDAIWWSELRDLYRGHEPRSIQCFIRHVYWSILPDGHVFSITYLVDRRSFFLEECLLCLPI